MRWFAFAPYIYMYKYKYSYSYKYTGDFRIHCICIRD